MSLSLQAAETMNRFFKGHAYTQETSTGRQCSICLLTSS